MVSMSSIASAASANAQQFQPMQSAMRSRMTADAGTATANPVSGSSATSPGAAALQQGRAVTRAQTVQAVTAPGDVKSASDANPALRKAGDPGGDTPGVKMKAEIARQARIEVRAAIESSFLQAMMESNTEANRDSAMQTGSSIARDSQRMAALEMPEAGRAFRAEQEMSTQRFEAQLAELRSMLLDQGASSGGVDMRA